MPTKVDFVSKDQIRARAISKGLARPQAWVIAIIAYWSQHKGGVNIGTGGKWQWRGYDEIAAEIGYSTKSVGRAVAELKGAGLVEVQRIWHPTKLGQSVNAFRLTKKARELFNLPWPGMCNLIPQQGLFEKDNPSHPNPTNSHFLDSQLALSKYIGHTVEKTGNSAADSHVSETVAALFLQKFGKDYMPEANWNKFTKETIYNLWCGYKWLIRNAFDKAVGNYNAKREQWLIDYLRVFEGEGYAPWDSICALAIAISEWSSFAEILATNEGKPHFVHKDYPDPYTLGVYGHLILEFYRDTLESSIPA